LDFGFEFEFGAEREAVRSIFCSGEECFKVEKRGRGRGRQSWFCWEFHDL